MKKMRNLFMNMTWRVSKKIPYHPYFLTKSPKKWSQMKKKNKKRKLSKTNKYNIFINKLSPNSECHITRARY